MAIAYHSVLDHLTKGEQVSLLARINYWCQTIPFTYGCEVWDGGSWENGHGYARIQVKGKPFYVHRARWELTCGRIPEGRVLDHCLCLWKPCIRLDHLEPVTVAENTRRGLSWTPYRKAEDYLKKPTDYGDPVEGL